MVEGITAEGFTCVGHDAACCFFPWDFEEKQGPVLFQGVEGDSGAAFRGGDDLLLCGGCGGYGRSDGGCKFSWVLVRSSWGSFGLGSADGSGFDCGFG